MKVQCGLLVSTGLKALCTTDITWKAPALIIWTGSGITSTAITGLSLARMGSSAGSSPGVNTLIMSRCLHSGCS